MVMIFLATECMIQKCLIVKMARSCLQCAFSGADPIKPSCDMCIDVVKPSKCYRKSLVLQMIGRIIKA
jgi:hypothetical protein